MKSPYSNLPSRSYWRTGVVERHALSMGDIYLKKFDIRSGEKIATAGSCFAQHIANQLRDKNYEVLDVEPLPPSLSKEESKEFGFNLYSARYGNVYTIRQMLQLAQEAFGIRTPREIVWEKDGRFYDALRPSVEPFGLTSEEAVHKHRRQHISRVRSLFGQSSLVIFTMGLTETWENAEDGTVYPTAPGTIAGSYDPKIYRFRNLNYSENLQDFIEFRRILNDRNADVRFLITVSPVPLTATATNNHVLAATTYSKSVLRAVAGELYNQYNDIDYFPSFEIVSGIHSRSQFYENNLRSVAAAGVDVVMKSFFEQHVKSQDTSMESSSSNSKDDLNENPIALKEQKIFCEDELLEAFAK